MAAAAIFDVLFAILDHPRVHDVPLTGCIFPGSGIMIRSDVTEILRFYDIAHLTGKCLFTSLLVSLWE